MSSPNLAELVANAERIAKDIESRGGEYLYDSVFVYHDGFQYWLCTESGDEIALEPRTLQMFLAFVRKRECGKVI